MQAVWQKYIDASISSTVNLKSNVMVEDIFNLYIEAWKNGLKGITVYRDGCARNPILSDKSKKDRLSGRCKVCAKQYKEDNKEKSEILDLAVSTLYLNRTNRSGIIKAGVIGGKKQDGNYKMDCRFNRERLADQIIHISKSSDKISFHNMDAVDFINYIEGLNLSKPILMVDPPYYSKGQSLYTNFYMHNDHANIANKLKETSIPWLLTYDNTPEISKLYSDFSQYHFSINYSAARKRIGTELFITSRDFDVIQHELLNIA